MNKSETPKYFKRFKQPKNNNNYIIIRLFFSSNDGGFHELVTINLV